MPGRPSLADLQLSVRSHIRLAFAGLEVRDISQMGAKIPHHRKQAPWNALMTNAVWATAPIFTPTPRLPTSIRWIVLGVGLLRFEIDVRSIRLIAVAKDQIAEW